MKRKRKKKNCKPILFWLCVLMVIGAGFAAVMLSQQDKLNQLRQEQAALTEEYDGLMVETERLRRMLDYVNTEQYMLQYAREKLGYVMPEDIRFYKNETPAP